MNKGLYKKTFEGGRNDTGFDYEFELLRRTLSPRFFGGNEMTEGFLSHLNKMIYELVESVKYLRVYFNYTVRKDERNIN